ncbi:MAG: DNA primase [Sorangiineae bacterium NIC37A_2]|nr:MAG: DNA primase [Sorangiineae bacterium NIC37A_2]
MLAPELIDRIRDRSNIREVIAESVKLERRGRSYIGLCPFHGEKTPSFHVHEDRGFYHCFGCQASGDVIKFVMEIEGLTFIEAVRRLGERAGIEVKDDLSDQEQKQRRAQKQREDELYNVGAVAAQFFEQMLREHPDRAFAEEELERRGLSLAGPEAEILRSFRVGYAPPGWDGLTQHLARSGINPRAAETAGLIVPRRQGSGHYDRFRHRLMFAVHDLHGRIVAFSGRALRPRADDSSEEPPAKYINSPESPVYRKRETVFGLFQARAALRSGQPAILVEGNFDVLSLHARGVRSAVAPLGTAFTVDQARLVRRFTTDVVVLFDGDSAGKKATRAAREPCLEAGLRARVARLPTGKDPDDFVRSEGPAQLEAVVARAPGMLDYLIAESLDGALLHGDSQAVAAKIQEVTDLIAQETDPTVRALAEQHADRLAERLGITDARTFRALKQKIARAMASPGSKSGRPPLPTQARPGSAAPTFSPGSVEAHTLGALLDFPELLADREVQEFLPHMNGDLALAIAVLARAKENPDSVNFHETLAKMPEPLRPFARARLAAPVHQTAEVARRELLGNLRKLLQAEHSRMARSTQADIERARLEGNLEQELSLLKSLEERARARHGSSS